MDKRKVFLWGIILAVILLGGSAVIMLCNFIFVKNVTYRYQGVEEVFYNPMMGFAPNANYIDAVGDNTLVYVDVTWRELEPEEGQYDFASIREENYLEEWRKQGKKVVFRFICDNPSDEEHMDIPDWLYEKTADGTFYDMAYGKGYSPDYENETLIACHKKAIEALGAEFGGDSFFCFIELGSIGHWGEWHVKYDEGIARIPGEEVCRAYILPYIEAFPNARFLMRRPFASVSEYGFGVYNDMTGEPESTKTWLSWIADGGVYDEAKEPLTLAACPSVWETAPVGGEFTSSLTMEELLREQAAQTAALLASSHMTFIGPKCPIANQEQLEYPIETDAVLKNLGYRYGVTEARLHYNFLRRTVNVEFFMQNTGTAPMYFDWAVCLYVLDESGEVQERVQTEVKLSELSQGNGIWEEASLSFDKENEKSGFKIAIGIENPESGEPEVFLNMDTEHAGKRYLLNGTQ